MKQYLFLAITFSLFNSLWAQDFYITNSNLEIVSTNVNASDLEASAYLVNNTAQTLNIQYTINGGSPLTTDWLPQSIGFCNDATCDDPEVTTGGSFTILPGDSTWIHITLFPQGIEDEITTSIQYNAVGSGLDRITANIHLKVSNPTSIKAIDASTLSLFPNPTSSSIQIKGLQDVSGLTTFEVYNIIGKKVSETQVSNINDLKVDVRNWDSGIYLVKLYDNKNDLIYTKTFVKN